MIKVVYMVEEREEYQGRNFYWTLDLFTNEKAAQEFHDKWKKMFPNSDATITVRNVYSGLS